MYSRWICSATISTMSAEWQDVLAQMRLCSAPRIRSISVESQYQSSLQSLGQVNP